MECPLPQYSLTQYSLPRCHYRAVITALSLPRFQHGLRRFRARSACARRPPPTHRRGGSARLQSIVAGTGKFVSLRFYYEKRSGIKSPYSSPVLDFRNLLRLRALLVEVASTLLQTPVSPVPFTISVSPPRTATKQVKTRIPAFRPTSTTPTTLTWHKT
jgi:hypothetical protein